jgi:tripartite-type tricarboxylate transporter receptor subunit TctC
VLAAVVATPEFRQDLERNHWSASFARSADMRKRLEAEHAELKPLLTELGMVK